uniref:Tudor domain-containing protein n=1 Tax=Caenorhabditis tropicalis TaxID=1561998 RepID=A0A1I7TCC5_9PELO
MIGLIVFERILTQLLSFIYSQKNENQCLIEDDECTPEDDDIDPEFRLPYFTESESEEDVLYSQQSLTPSSSSSGYNTDHEIDMDWEIFKIVNAPPGPVPPNQVYLVLTCQLTGVYVKTVVDKNHSMVYILSYEKLNNQWSWIETTCSSCIANVRRALSEGGCTVPFAIDQLNYDANSEPDDYPDDIEENRSWRMKGSLTFNS